MGLVTACLGLCRTASRSNSNSRYSPPTSSFARPTFSSRLPIVPVLSSEAKIPLPGAAIYAATSARLASEDGTNILSVFSPTKLVKCLRNKTHSGALANQAQETCPRSSDLAKSLTEVAAGYQPSETRRLPFASSANIQSPSGLAKHAHLASQCRLYTTPGNHMCMILRQRHLQPCCAEDRMLGSNPESARNGATKLQPAGRQVPASRLSTHSDIESALPVSTAQHQPQPASTASRTRQAGC